MHSILILHSCYGHFPDGKVLTFSRNASCNNPCDKKCSLQICQGCSFPYYSQSPHPPQYGLGSSHGFLHTQSLHVPPVLGCVWDNVLSWICLRFCLCRTVAAQALQQYVSSPLDWKGSSFQRSWKIMYRSVGFVYLLKSGFHIISFWQCNNRV